MKRGETLLPVVKKKKALPKEKRLTIKKELKNLKDFLKKEQEKSHNYLKQLTYLQADFDNYKKRIQKEYDENVFGVKAPLLKNILNIVDELKIALKESKKTENYEAIIEGLEMILKKMTGLLESEGLIKIETTGKRFDPKYHEAIMEVKGKEKEVGAILEEIRSGYVYKERVFRPSLVKIVTSFRKREKEKE